jgi:hypothetical protein
MDNGPPENGDGHKYAEVAFSKPPGGEAYQKYASAALLTFTTTIKSSHSDRCCALAMLHDVLVLVERGGRFGADCFVSWFSAKLDSESGQGGKREFSLMTLGQFFAAKDVDLHLWPPKEGAAVPLRGERPGGD